MNSKHGISTIEEMDRNTHAVEPAHSKAEDWERLCTTSNNGEIDGRNVANIMVVLRNASEWRGVLAYDRFAQRVVVRRPLPRPEGMEASPESGTRELADVDVTWALEWFHSHRMVGLREAQLFSRMVAAAHENDFHPVHDFFADVTRGEPPAEVSSSINAARIDPALAVPDALSMLMTLGFGAEDTLLNRAISRAFMIAVVRRVRLPGCQHDHMLVLDGAQGIGKSTGLRTLIGSEWFTDHMPNLQSKDAMLQLRGKLLIEWSEMATATHARADRIKAFITAPEDTFRAPYEKSTHTVKRVCSFAGTTNIDDWLVDSTGGRRFWPVECSTVDREWIAANRHLLWRLACEAETLGEDNWIVAADLQKEVIERQADVQRIDPWEAHVLNHASPGVILTGAFVHEAVGKFVQDQNNGDLQRVAGILRKNGWKRTRKRKGDEGRHHRWYPQKQGK